MVNINESNYILYAAANYDNAQCYDINEFNEDINRFKYIKRLFSRYKENGDLKERLILNHLIILYNVFPADVATRLLFFKLFEYRNYLKTFLVFLNYMPDIITGIGDKGITIISSDITLDNGIIERLRQI